MKNKFIIILLFIFTFYTVLTPFTLYYYNPDSNITNYHLLTRTFNDYFRKKIQNFELKTFINVETLFSEAETNPPDFMLIPYFNYILKISENTTSNEISNIITPILKSGKQTYRKLVLVSNASEITRIEDIKGNVGSVSYGVKSKNFIKEYIFPEQNLQWNDINFIWVRKDIDNLYALMFNQMDAVIVCDKVYNELKKDSSFLIENARIIYESPDIPEVVVSLVSDMKEENLNEIKQMFLDMHQSVEGNNLLQILGYKKWLKISL